MRIAIRIAHIRIDKIFAPEREINGAVFRIDRQPERINAVAAHIAEFSLAAIKSLKDKNSHE